MSLAESASVLDYFWTVRPKTRIVVQLATLLAGLGTASCSAFDVGEDTDGNSADTDVEPAEYPGHIVECCFSGTWASAGYADPHQQQGCQVQPECLDPSAYDLDGNGEIGAQEVRSFCNQKCSPPWNGADAVRPNWNPPGPAGDVLWSCSALPSSSVVESNSCSPPSEIKSYGENVDVAPEYEATLSSQSGGRARSGSGVDLVVSGAEVHPDSRLKLAFALDSCQRGGLDGGSCRLVLSRLELSSASHMQVGDYSVSDVSLELAQPIATTVHFENCRRTGCSGDFVFSRAHQNPLQTTLRWVQLPSDGRPPSEGALMLGNSAEALGGIEALTGTLTMNRDETSGTIHVNGLGKDSLGGDWARLEFSISGGVAPI